MLRKLFWGFLTLVSLLPSTATIAEDANQHVTQALGSEGKGKLAVPKVSIRMWTSRNGGAKKENVIEDVDIGGLYLDGLLAYDIQYEDTLKFRGLKLRDLISQYKPIPQGFDYILLHSKLGMIVPVAISELRQDTEVFIALSIFDKYKKKWLTDFPSGVYSQPNQAEKISIEFKNNKMVVGKNWRHTDFAITPWRFFDSLEGVEFISSQDYYQAIQPGIKNSELGGRSVYMRRCQYCHGVGEFGSKYGPNFVSLLPDDKKAAEEMILNKVLPPTDPKNKLPIKGRMPKQNDFKKSEAKDLVNWVSSWKKNASASKR